MLVLTRKLYDEIKVEHKGEELIIRIEKSSKSYTRLSFDGPRSFEIDRKQSDKQPSP